MKVKVGVDRGRRQLQSWRQAMVAAWTRVVVAKDVGEVVRFWISSAGRASWIC